MGIGRFTFCFCLWWSSLYIIVCASVRNIRNPVKNSTYMRVPLDILPGFWEIGEVFVEVVFLDSEREDVDVLLPAHLADVEIESQLVLGGHECKQLVGIAVRPLEVGGRGGEGGGGRGREGEGGGGRGREGGGGGEGGGGRGREGEGEGEREGEGGGGGGKRREGEGEGEGVD